MTIDLQLQVASKNKTIPSPTQLKEWVNIVLKDKIKKAELTLRIVDKLESADLNLNYRKKEGPTNVLSFSYTILPYMELDVWGDIIICAPIVEEEALACDKSLISHWAHITIHGILHLLGFDHIDPLDATKMEALEIKIMAELGFSSPYLEIAK